MSDRLNELRRQRALVQQHLEWLEAEIVAAEQKTRATAALRAPAPAAARTDGPPSPIESISLRETSLSPDLDALLAAQKSAPADSAADVKRGCFIAFAALFAVLGLAVYGLYLYSKSRH